MFLHAGKAMFAVCLAPHHENGNGGASESPTDVNDNEQPTDANANPVTAVDAHGPSVETVILTLETVPAELTRLVEGKSDDDLMQPAQDGGWGLVEILPHFRDWEEITAERVEAVLNEDEPSIEEYDDSLWAIEHAYRDQDPREALEQFIALRTALVERLKELEPEQWNRIGILPKRGRVTLHWLLNNITNHDAKHIVQARDVLA